MKTVKMLGVLVLGFTLCWTPYYVMSIWSWAHKSSAEQLDFRLQKLLWAFACLNNCINPLLYSYRCLIDIVPVSAYHLLYNEIVHTKVHTGLFLMNGKK